MAAYGTVYYARLVLQDPSNQNNLKDGAIVAGDIDDFDSDGDTTEKINLGGHLINTASVQYNFVNNTGGMLLQPDVEIGRLTNGSLLASYRVSDGPVVPAAANAFFPTTAEMQEIQTSLGAYYRLGSVVSRSPALIDGYVTPVVYSGILTSATNVHNFVYQVAPVVANTNTPGLPGATSGAGLANTGTDMLLPAAISLAVIILSSGLFVHVRRRSS